MESHIKYIVEKTINRIDSEFSVLSDEVVDEKTSQLIGHIHLLVSCLLEDMDRELEIVGGY